MNAMAVRLGPGNYALGFSTDKSDMGIRFHGMRTDPIRCR
jgi:hypothetical protein